MRDLKGNFIIFFILFLAMLLVSNIGLAQPLYITDKIPIPIYAEANKKSPLVKQLPSGTLVFSKSQSLNTATVKSTSSNNKFIEIETKDGISGWIEAIYLSNEKPTQIVYLQLAAKYKAAEATIKDYETRLLELQELRKEVKTVDWLRNQLNENKKREATFEHEIKLREIALAESKFTVASLEEKLLGSTPDTQNNQPLVTSKENQPLSTNYVEDIGVYANSSSIRFYTWLVLSLAVTLIIGILLGFVLIDYKARKKSGYAKEY